MSRISRILRLRSCGVFRNFTWPSNLPDFGRYNLIYGWNGTGKTTLSRIFQDLQVGRKPTIGEVVLLIDGGDVSGDSFRHSTLGVRVFNRDFIQDNVFPVGGDDMPPILVLGAENVKKQKEIERLKELRAEAQRQLTSARLAEQSANDEVDQFCIDSAKPIKDTLRTSGQNPYNYYNKTSFRADAQEMAGASDRITDRLADAERRILLARHQGTSKPKIPTLNYALPDLNAIADRLVGLLTTTIVSAAIAALKADPSLSDWTRRGLKLHRDREAARCLFCDQPLAAHRLEALKAHFNAEYERLVQRVDEEINSLKAESEASETIQIPSATALYDHLVPELQTGERSLREALVSVRGFLAASVQTLEDKKRRGLEEMRLELKTPRIAQDLVVQLNAVIKRHNEECDAFESQVDEARRRLAGHMIAAKLQEFVRLREVTVCATAGRRMEEQRVLALDDEIAELEREIVEHRQPAEELNRNLQTYLGHGELCLEIQETGYTVIRGGGPACTVSEGESTAIALLYFLKSLQDRRFDLEHGVVVLDDPVSSLDSNALFLAFGFIRERTGDAGQLFILTHNFSFFRQVLNWFQHLKGQKKNVVGNRPAQFFMLDAAQKDKVRNSVIRSLDPLLADYESEYQYLFARIHQAATASASQDLEANYSLPNMARRILEAFLAFRQPQVSGELWRKMNAVPFDDAKKLRILRFLHTHSHSIAVGEPEHDLTALAEGPSVLNDLLEMIESLDRDHFLAMVQLVSPSADSGQGAR